MSSVSYRLENLMNPDSFLEKCISLAPDELPYIIAHFSKKTNYLTYEKEDEKFFSSILFSTEMNALYQANTALEIIRYYQTKGPQPLVKEFLEKADFESMPQSVRQYMLEMLVDYHMYEKAYDLIQKYGMDQVGSAAKVTLSSYAIDALGDEEEDEYLLRLCACTFSDRKYNDKMLGYLADFYSGPPDVMLALWKAAREFEVNTFELEERILVQMLYANMKMTEVEDLFAYYYEAGGRELVVLAYITYCAHAYFVREEPISPDVLLIIKDRYLHNMELNDACKLALLKALSEKPGDDEDFVIEDNLLAEYTCRNMNFAFYKKLDRRLVQKYHLYDKVFLEYRTDPKKHVVLHYSRDEDGEEFIREDMPDVYDGIFVEQFVLFFGETVQYYITEEYGNQVDVTESSRLMSNDVYSQKDESRYNLLNQMLMSGTLSDDKSLYHTMKQYAGFDEVTKKIFKVL